MKNFATFVLMLIIIVINNTILFADSPELNEAVRITKMKIIGEPLKDKRVILQVEYISLLNIDASIKLIFSNCIKPANYFGEGNFVEETQRLNDNQSYRKEFKLDIKDIGNSIITFAIRIEELVGYNNAVSRYLSFEINESDYLIYDEKSEIIETQPQTINSQRETKSRETDALYTVSVSGNVKFFDSHQGANKGLYGNTVELWFRNSNNPNNWYHPVYSPNCTGNQHVHYDVVDVNGNYNFNFSFNGDLSNYNQVLVIVSRDNSAANMPVQQNGITTWCDNSYRHWFSLSESFIGNISGSNTNITLTNANCIINSADGEIFRNMMFSREFVVQRYNGSLTFPLPNIYVIRTDLPYGIAGWFISGGSGVIPRIEIDNLFPEATTTSHEFGHFVNYKMWNNFLIGDDGCSDELGNTIPGTGRIYKEGWAIHYSFCTRNYANKVYGDNLRSGDDNTETAAYESPRFNNIRYTSIDPNISAHACYLWNLYDDYNNGNFESNIFLGDNDDISGRSVRVFETMRTPIMDCASKFNNRFKVGLTSEEQTSVHDIYTFMLLNVNHNPRSAQISNASAQVISSNQIHFQWSSRSYPTNFYRNYESGYRIYKKVNNIWQLVYTAPAGTTNYTYQTTQTYGDFKITSYNQRGDSYAPTVLNVPVVPPIISHFSQSPNPICRGSWGNVYVHLSQGNENLSYTWTPDPPYLQYEPHGSYCTVWIPNSAMNPENETYALYCTVSNGAGSANGSTLIFHTVCSGCPTLAFNVGGEMTDDNPLLITSLSNPGVDVTDYYLVQNPITPVGNKINLRIHEPQTEHTWLDYVELIEAKVKSDELVAVNDEGEVVNYSNNTPVVSVFLNGTTDITEILSSMDTLDIKLAEGDTLTIQRNIQAPENDGDGDLVLGGTDPIKDVESITLSLAKTEDIEGDNPKLGDLTFFFRPNKSIIAKKLRSLPPGNIEITINQELTLNYLTIVKNLKTARVNSLSLLSANHQQLGNVKNLLTGIDQNYAEIFPGDIIDFEFQKGTIPAKKIAYILKSVGRYETDTSFTFNKITGTSAESQIPMENRLFENYPNPFNPTTQIKYSVKENGMVTLKVYDILGNEVSSLVNEEKQAGTHTETFDARNLSSGIYFYTITTKDFRQTKKMILLK